MDSKGWEGFTSLFTDDLVIDFDETTSQPRSKDELVASAARRFEKNLSVDQVHNAEVELIDATHAGDLADVHPGGEDF